MTSRLHAIILCAVMATGLAGCGKPTPDRATMMAVVDEFQWAFEAEDAARMGELLSADASFVFYGTGLNEMQTSREEFLTKHRDQDWAMLDEIRFAAPAFTNIQSSPGLAVVMYQTTLSFVAGGEAASVPVRIVLTLVPEDGKWRIRQGLASQLVE